MVKTNKYAYDKRYYEGLRAKSFNGNAARKLDTYVDDESYDMDEELLNTKNERSESYRYAKRSSAVPAYEPEEETYTAPSRRERYRRNEESVNVPKPVKEPKTRIHRKVEINIIYTVTMIAAVFVLLASTFKMLETKSDITQTEKKITIAKNELADITALNESLKASLDTQIDRNYIYSVAVGKLGMVYPNNNKVVYYDPADSGHVRQLSYIP